MTRVMNVKNCRNFKAMDQDFGAPLRRRPEGGCRQCVYFSSRNCGMDVADSIEPTIDVFS